MTFARRHSLGLKMPSVECSAEQNAAPREVEARGASDRFSLNYIERERASSTILSIISV